MNNIIAQALFVCIATLSFVKPSFSVDNFKTTAAESIKSVFESDKSNDFSLMRSKTKEFYLYTSNIKGKSLLEKITCKNSSSFNIVSKNKARPNSIASIGIINIGLCDSLTEINRDLLVSQKTTHELMQSIIKKSRNNVIIDNAIKYNAKNFGRSLHMEYFTIALFGHGAMVSPTAIITSDKSNKIGLIQFEMPPNCKYVENHNLTICKDIEKTFEIIAISLFNE